MHPSIPPDLLLAVRTNAFWWPCLMEAPGLSKEPYVHLGVQTSCDPQMCLPATLYF